MSEEIKYPQVSVSAFIFNKNNELLLFKSPKWHNKYTSLGGKVEFDESLEQALKREIKEEVNLEIEHIKLIDIIDGLELTEYNSRGYKHLIFIDYKARLKSGEIKLSDEASNYKWLSIDEWLKIDEKEFAPYILSVINKIKTEEETNLDKYKRALADYQNLLKQTAREKMEFVVYANEQMIKEILPVYDHLKMAIKHCDNELNNSWLEGVRHVVKQFKDVLEKIGVEEIEVKDKKFDPNLMDAISSEETDDKNLDEQVAKQVMAGYKLNGKVIKVARVVVYKVK
ncbi:nucleotide exchange factor GrpE [Candidatus Kuenenbacteria bacterium]|nr:nucleotide exchange factor GrpE [Candidatus Kuenenbacteria bacterium]